MTNVEAPIVEAPAVDLRSTVLEQVMRLTGDELALLRFVDAQPGSFLAKVALGRLLSEPGIRLVAGSPLFAFLAGGPVDPNWRASYPPRPASLWSELELTTSLLGIPLDTLAGDDPYEALCTLRARTEEDFPAA